jgi:GDP-L-fucose synthase
MKITRKNKILLLGGTGFLGKTIYENLKNKFKIKILSKRLGQDLRNPQVIKKYLKTQTYDYIINCAAHVGGLNYLKKFSADIVSDNVKIVTNLYAGVKNAKKTPIVINLVSNCFYPEKLKIQKEKNWQDGRMHKSVESFGIYKRLIVIMSKSFEIQYGIKSINLILPNAFGPGDHLDPTKSHALNAIIVRMIEAKKQKQKFFEVWGTGKPKREWIYSIDVARFIKRLLKKNFNKSLIVNVAQNKAHTINKIASIVKKSLGYKGRIVNNTSYEDGAILKQLDDEKFKKIFKDFTFTNFNLAIRNTVKYYKKI